jgi:hypothetical protein
MFDLSTNSTTGLSPLYTIRLAFAAGTPGTPDDVTIYSANAPFAFRVLDSQVLISTLVALATVQLRNATGGGGDAVSDAFVAASLGRVRDTAVGISNATQTISAGGTLVLRRSDRGVAGEVILLIRRM